MTSALAAGTFAFAVGTGVVCGVRAATGRELVGNAITAIWALEIALLALVGVHVMQLLSDAGAVSPKRVAYLSAGALLVPVIVLGAGGDRRARAISAAVACLAAAVLVLRIEVVA